MDALGPMGAFPPIFGGNIRKIHLRKGVEFHPELHTLGILSGKIGALDSDSTR